MKTLTHQNTLVMSDKKKVCTTVCSATPQIQMYREGDWKRGASPVSQTSFLSYADMAVGGAPVVSSTRVLAGDPVTAVACKVGATRFEIPLRSD